MGLYNTDYGVYKGPDGQNYFYNPTTGQLALVYDQGSLNTVFGPSWQQMPQAFVDAATNPPALPSTVSPQAIQAAASNRGAVVSSTGNIQQNNVGTIGLAAGAADPYSTSQQRAAPAGSTLTSNPAASLPGGVAPAPGTVSASSSQPAQMVNLSSQGFQQFQQGGTWFGYNPQTQQLIAFPDAQTLQTVMGQPVNAQAPQLPFASNHPMVQGALSTPASAIGITGTPVAASPAAAPGAAQPGSTGALPTKYQTGNAQVDAVLGSMYNFIQGNIASGKTLNPDLNIDANTIQQFINQAHQEIDPYYATLLGSVKDDLIANLQTNAQQYNATIGQEASTFKQNLLNTRENLAGAGLAFSGVRGQQEEQAQSTEQTTLDLDKLRAASTAAAAARQAEQQIGTSGVSGIAFPTVQPYSVSTAGEGSVTPGSAAPYFTPGGGSAGSVLGTIPAQQTTDINTRVAGLKADLLQKRSLTGLTTP